MYMFCKYFLATVPCIFRHLTMCFKEKSCNFDVIQYANFFLMPLVSYLRNFYHIQGHKDGFSMFSLRKFIVLVLYLCLWFMVSQFLCRVKSMDQNLFWLCICCICISKSYSTNLLKVILSPLKSFNLCQKPVVHIHVGLFWNLYFSH